MKFEAPKIVFLFQLIQDFPVLEPVMNRLRVSGGWRLEAWVADRVHLLRKSRLEKLGFPCRVFSHAAAKLGLFPSFGDAKAFVSASESSLKPHWIAHKLAARAKHRGLRTFTFQHGLEQPGLTYATKERVEFLSDSVFLWGGLETLHSQVGAETRRKCIPVGRPSAQALHPLAFSHALQTPFIAVFENLHWDRFSEVYRENFLKDLGKCAECFPQIHFVLRPHPNNRWSVARTGELKRLPNFTLADPKALEWEEVDAGDLCVASAAVISTPSTTVLDAALAGRAVAVALYDIKIDFYDSLTVLKSADDWNHFVEASLKPEVIDSTALFKERLLLDGDACERIDHLLKKDVHKRSNYVIK